jgi:dienelactone hydrolase
MKKLLTAAFLLFVLAISSAYAELREEEVAYKVDGVSMKGLIVYDDAIKEKRPGILVVHEWWGHNEHARNQARRLAKSGYVGFAIDLYGDGKVTTHPEEAGKFSGEIAKNMEMGKARFTAAQKLLQGHKMVDPEKIGANGYCFGGSVVLEMALSNIGLDGVTSFHGGLTTKTEPEPGSVKTKVLACHGAADKFSSQEEVDAFKKKMERLKVDYQFIAYEGAMHSFTNPEADEIAKTANIPVGYNKAADEKSWADMLAFYKKVFAN